MKTRWSLEQTTDKKTLGKAFRMKVRIEDGKMKTNGRSPITVWNKLYLLLSSWFFLLYHCYSSKTVKIFVKRLPADNWKLYIKPNAIQCFTTVVEPFTLGVIKLKILGGLLEITNFIFQKIIIHFLKHEKKKLHIAIRPCNVNFLLSILKKNLFVYKIIIFFSIFFIQYTINIYTKSGQAGLDTNNGSQLATD